MGGNAFEALRLKTDFAAKFGDLDNIIDALDRRAKDRRGENSLVTITGDEVTGSPVVLQINIVCSRPGNHNLRLQIRHYEGGTRLLNFGDLVADPIPPVDLTNGDSLAQNLNSAIDGYLDA